MANSPHIEAVVFGRSKRRGTGSAAKVGHVQCIAAPAGYATRADALPAALSQSSAFSCQCGGLPRSPKYEGLEWLERLQKYKDLAAKGALPAAVGGLSLYPTAGFPMGQPQQPPPGTSSNSVPWWQDQSSLYGP
jgi:hypothetical protein